MGADPAAAQATYNSATALFNAYTAASIGSLKSSGTLRQQFLSLAGTLEYYNNRLLGRGHC